MNYTKTKHFCPLPFTQVFVDTHRQIRLCCGSEYSQNQYFDNLSSFWESHYIQDVRKRMLADDPISECQICYDMEKHGAISDRQYHIEFLQLNYPDIELNARSGNAHQTPLIWDLRPGNLCNLKCRMCNSHISSAFYNEVQQNPYLEKYSSKFPTYTDWLSSPDVINDFLQSSHHIKVFKMAGGEPILMKSVNRILDYCIEHGHSKNIILDITTNGLSITDDFLKKVACFNSANFSFSIDAFGKVNEYIRPPSRWDDIVHRFERCANFIENHGHKYTLNPQCAVQLYNIVNIDQFIEWYHDICLKYPHSNLRDINFILVFYPLEFSPTLLPIEARKFIKNKVTKCITRLGYSGEWLSKTRLQHALSEIESAPAPTHQQILQFLQRTKEYDSVRSESLKESIPDLYHLFESYFS